MIRIFAYTEEGKPVSRHILVRTEGCPHVNLQFKYVVIPNRANSNVALPYLSLGINNESYSFSSKRYNALEPFPSSVPDYLIIGGQETVNEHTGKSLIRYPRRPCPGKTVAANPTPERTGICHGDDEWLVCRVGEQVVVFGFGARNVSHVGFRN
jgi:hypothetical protein